MKKYQSLITFNWLIPGLFLWTALHLSGRIHDPVVVQGGSLPEFLEQPVENIRVLTFNAIQQTWNPILFQIDELDNDGVYYGNKDGLLGNLDELVLMAKDMGDPAGPDQWPANAEAQHHERYEIRISDPLAPDETSYAYVFLSPSMEKLNNTYFNINEEEDWVKTPTYTIWHAGHGFQAGLYLHKAAGGDSISIIERQKFRIIGRISAINEEIAILEEQDGPIKLLGGLVSIDVYVGPKDILYLPGHKIRLHRYMELEYRINGKVLSESINKSGSYQFLTTFYPTFAEWQSGELDIPKISDVKIREVRLTTDLRGNAWGMRFYNPYNHDPSIRVDKTGDTYNDDLAWPGDSWHMIVANPEDPDKRVNTATLLTVTRIPTVPTYSHGRLYYKDSQSKVSHDTGDEKSWGDTGFQMTGNDLYGPLDFYTATYYLPENLNYTQGENLAALHLNPLQTDVTSQTLAYSVTVNTEPNETGTVTVRPDLNEHPAYSEVTLTAEPVPGYDFVRWTGDLESTENPIRFDITQNMILTAHFEPRMHEITFLSDPQGLFVTLDNVVRSTPAVETWQEATTHQIEIDSVIAIDAGSRLAFLAWNPENNERNFQWTVEGPEQFEAQFIRQFLLSAEPEDPASGQISIPGDDPWIDEGSETTVLAIPASNYSFSHWSGDTVSNTPALTLMMDRPWSVAAHFTNTPPLFSDADTSMAEDDSLHLSLDDLEQWVQDDNSPLSSLSFVFSETEFLKTEADPVNHMYHIAPVADWFGRDTIWVTVSDPLGASTAAPMIITVEPVPDPPGHFSLLTPEHETGISEWPVSVEFTWELPTDPDPSDTLTYIFELDTSAAFDSPAKIRLENIQWNQYILLWPRHLGDDSYHWRISAKDKTGLMTTCESVFTLSLTTDVASGEAIPADYILEQNYPNPFNGNTTIRYGLPHDGQVNISIFNSQGQIVKKLWEGHQKAGYHTLIWHGTNRNQRLVPSGMYLIMLRTPDRKQIKKAILIQ